MTSQGLWPYSLEEGIDQGQPSIKLWPCTFELLTQKKEQKGVGQQYTRQPRSRKRTYKAKIIEAMGQSYGFVHLKKALTPSSFKFYHISFESYHISSATLNTYTRNDKGEQKECTTLATISMGTPSWKQGNMKGSWPQGGTQTFCSLGNDVRNEGGNL
jgi:hypothetical protein